MARTFSLLLLAGFAATAASASSSHHHHEEPIRVFVLAGQSNMVGHAKIFEIDDSTGLQKNATLEWLVDNVPDQFGMLKQPRRNGGTSWTVRPDVLIACNSRELDDLNPVVTSYGYLSPGLCAGDPGQYQLGPELGFGWAVGDAFHNHHHRVAGKILLLKIAWGGKSLAVDFRPPSSVGYPTGPYYESMIANVRNTLANIAQIFPTESRGRLLQLSGFAWHQGWNDGCDDRMAAEYQYNLANLIRDVRRDLNAPDLPFAIASTGMLGYRSDLSIARQNIIDAEWRVAKFPEFVGNVASVDTRPFARAAAPSSPTDMEYHWMSNAESYWLLGKSLGEAMVDLVNRWEGGFNSRQRTQIS